MKDIMRGPRQSQFVEGLQHGHKKTSSVLARLADAFAVQTSAPLSLAQFREGIFFVWRYLLSRVGHRPSCANASHRFPEFSLIRLFSAACSCYMVHIVAG